MKLILILKLYLKYCLGKRFTLQVSHSNFDLESEVSLVCYWGLLWRNSFFVSKCFCSQPAKEVAKVRSKEPVDAAALIAEALRRKFAHRHRLNSEQDAVEDFKLPIKEVKPQSETPLVRKNLFVSFIQNQFKRRVSGFIVYLLGNKTLKWSRKHV